MLNALLFSYSMNHFHEGRPCGDKRTCHPSAHYALPTVSTLQETSTISGCGSVTALLCVCTGELSRECTGINVCVLRHSGQQFPQRGVGCASVLYWRLHCAAGGLRDSVCP